MSDTKPQWMQVAEKAKRELEEAVMSEIGWFGIPGSFNSHDATKVHVVRGNKPICGARMRQEMALQRCGYNLKYVECGSCIRIERAKR